MIIITNSQNATMYYSESQWLDLDGSGTDFGKNAWGFRVPNSTNPSKILGTPAISDPMTGIVTPATPPMTQQEVENIATEILFSPTKED